MRRRWRCGARAALRSPSAHSPRPQELQTHLQDTLTRGGELSDEVVRLKDTVGQREAEVGEAKEECSRLQKQLETQREDARTRCATRFGPQREVPPLPSPPFLTRWTGRAGSVR